MVAYVPTFQDQIDVIRVTNSEFDNYYIQTSGSADVVLNGIINQSSVNEVIEYFETDNERTVLFLNSPGGILVSSFILADYIRDNNIPVVADGECVSACVFLLAAANVSAVTPQTNLIFHHPEDLVDFRNTENIALADRETQEFYRRLEEYGVSLESLEQFKKTDFSPVSTLEAHRIGIVDNIWDPIANDFLDLSEFCERNDCEAPSINWYDLQPGVCFDRPEIIMAIDPIPCEHPHDAEVIGSYEISELELPFTDDCVPLFFESYVSLPYLESSLEVRFFYPLEETFNLGNRKIICWVHMPSEKIARSARDGQF